MIVCKKFKLMKVHCFCEFQWGNIPTDNWNTQINELYCVLLSSFACVNCCVIPKVKFKSEEEILVFAVSSQCFLYVCCPHFSPLFSTVLLVEYFVLFSNYKGCCRRISNIFSFLSLNVFEASTLQKSGLDFDKEDRYNPAITCAEIWGLKGI